MRDTFERIEARYLNVGQDRKIMFNTAKAKCRIRVNINIQTHCSVKQRGQSVKTISQSVCLANSVIRVLALLKVESKALKPCFAAKSISAPSN